MKRSFLSGNSLLFGNTMENEETYEEVKLAHKNSLLRIARALNIPRDKLFWRDVWSIEDTILSKIYQSVALHNRSQATIRKQQEEIDMLRQTSIFDFLKIHHGEIKSQETDDFMGDNE